MAIPDYERKVSKNTQGSKKRRNRFKTRSHMTSVPTFDHPVTYTILEKDEGNEGHHEPGIKITQAYNPNNLSPRSSLESSGGFSVQGAVRGVSEQVSTEGSSGLRRFRQNSLTVPENGPNSLSRSVNGSPLSSPGSLNGDVKFGIDCNEGPQGSKYEEPPIKRDYRKRGECVDVITKVLKNKNQ